MNLRICKEDHATTPIAPNQDGGLGYHENPDQDPDIQRCWEEIICSIPSARLRRGELFHKEPLKLDFDEFLNLGIKSSVGIKCCPRFQILALVWFQVGV